MAEPFAGISGVSKNIQNLTDKVPTIESKLNIVTSRLVVLETNVTDKQTLTKKYETAHELNAMKQEINDNFVSKAEYQRLAALAFQLKTHMKNEKMIAKDPFLDSDAALLQKDVCWMM